MHLLFQWGHFSRTDGVHCGVLLTHEDWGEEAAGGL